MIKLKSKYDCCGCQACINICPVKCISIISDNEGFLYPEFDENRCINCNKCEKACPILNKQEKRKPLKTLAAKNFDDITRNNSSSGGIFNLLANKTIENNGIVFGAKFDLNWNVIHGYCETINKIQEFQGSKYVQSNIKDSYTNVKNALKLGKKVLFSGTPCQIAGLKTFLNKDYTNLITVEVICHGVASPLIWQTYLNSIKKDKEICNVNFRDKTYGWRNFSLQILSKVDQDNFTTPLLQENVQENLFMQGFLKNIYLRPSCYKCQFKSGKSGADITLGDFWHIWKFNSAFYDNKGISAVIIYTNSGLKFIENIKMKSIEVPYKKILYGNPALEHSPIEPKERKLFWDRWRSENLLAINTIIKKMKISIFNRCLNKIKQIIQL